MFWMAPEILREINRKDKSKPTSQVDIYSYGVIMKELFCRNGPYTEYEDYTPKGKH